MSRPGYPTEWMGGARKIAPSTHQGFAFRLTSPTSQDEIVCGRHTHENRCTALLCADKAATTVNEKRK